MDEGEETIPLKTTQRVPWKKEQLPSRLTAEEDRNRPHGDCSG